MAEHRIEARVRNNVLTVDVEVAMRHGGLVVDAVNFSFSDDVMFVDVTTSVRLDGAAFTMAMWTYYASFSTRYYYTKPVLVRLRMDGHEVAETTLAPALV